MLPLFSSWLGNAWRGVVGRGFEVPEGDILIHSGDFSNYGLQHGLEEVEAFVSYFKSLPHQYKAQNREEPLPVEHPKKGCNLGTASSL